MQKMWQLLSDYRRNIFHGCFYLEEKEDTGDDHPSCLQLPSTSILPWTIQAYDLENCALTPRFSAEYCDDAGHPGHVQHKRLWLCPAEVEKCPGQLSRVQQHYGPGKGRIVCHMSLLSSTRLTFRSLDHRKGNHLSPWSQLLMRDLYILRPTQSQLSREETSFLLGQRKCFIKLGLLLCLKLLLVLTCSGALSRWHVSVWELSNNRRPWDATSLAFSVYEGNTAQG